MGVTFISIFSSKITFSFDSYTKIKNFILLGDWATWNFNSIELALKGEIEISGCEVTN